MNIARAVCVVSGGPDGAVAAAVAKSRGYDLYFLFFNYRQKALEQELRCLHLLSHDLGVRETKIVDLPWWSEIGGTILLKDKPALSPKNEPLEYVPFRNAIFTSFAISWCEVLNGEAVFFGSTKGARNCPDNTYEFFLLLQGLTKRGTKHGQNIKIETPLLHLSKAEGIALGTKLGLNFGHTWSCLNAGNMPCGLCSNCRMRQDAFYSLGWPDPCLEQLSGYVSSA